ncbi:NADPH-dependent FMN reductase domain protein [Ligilactobacillus ruminis DPC 6832]|uniref:NADPH-dependent FMN reductase domain protein n=1 Tax=Ligilactobacillus ruminis DPC 6832 TaxID=1402208 RepID=A0A837DSW8_9LACO|nr:NADPH-dependent FMN reductase domain protein [Ligilactobacillus ruminis DPC 6832]
MKRYFAAESEIGIFETSGIPILDKPKSKVALAEINELSDRIGAVDGASLQCQI